MYALNILILLQTFEHFDVLVLGIRRRKSVVFYIDNILLCVFFFFFLNLFLPPLKTNRSSFFLSPFFLISSTCTSGLRRKLTMKCWPTIATKTFSCSRCVKSKRTCSTSLWQNYRKITDRFQNGYIIATKSQLQQSTHYIYTLTHSVCQ